MHDDEVISLAKDIVYTHHERWDGSGYPRGLRGTAIPLAGRLVAVVDVYDALVEARAYKPAMPPDQARDIIAAGRGTHFDPDIVDAFLSLLRRLRCCGRPRRAAALAVCGRPWRRCSSPADAGQICVDAGFTTTAGASSGVQSSPGLMKRLVSILYCLS